MIRATGFSRFSGMILVLGLVLISLGLQAAKRRPLPPLPSPRPDNGLPWKLRKPWVSHAPWHPRVHELGLPAAWPVEPESPADPDPARFSTALQELCLPAPPASARKAVDPILEWSKTFNIDPFLLGGLVYRQNRCRRLSKHAGYSGITALPFNMIRPDLRQGTYRYHTLKGGTWTPAEIRLDRFRFSLASLDQVRPNLYFAAGLLSMWREICPDLDAALGGVRHRSFVSHFVWGDFVAEPGAEDRILTARRRLIAYYSGSAPPDAGEIDGIRLVPPLDGTPRLVLSPIGAIRDPDKAPREHRGIDIDAAVDEPVRAVADGFVAQAKVDMPSGERSQSVTPEEAERFPRSRMGTGGIFLCLGHGSRVHSCYMHLNSIAVKEGDTVKAGQLIGRVGRTGLTSATAHLHFELRVSGDPVDPLPIMKSVLLY